MAISPIDIGVAPNDNTGDPLRDAFIKVNANDVDLDGRITAITTLTTPEGFGAVGNGVVDDTTALASAFSAASTSKLTVFLAPGKTYLFSQLVIPAGIAVVATGSTLKYDGALLLAGDIAFDIGNDCRFDTLKMTSPGTEANTNNIRLGARVHISGDLDMSSVAQRSGGSFITTKGDEIYIGGTVRSRKVDRTISLDNTGGPVTSGSFINFLDIQDYVRAFNAIQTNNWKIGGHRLAVRSPNASFTAGNNGYLINDCSGWFIGDGIIENAGEHAIRLGGSLAAQENAYIGHQVIRKSGGTALKVNPLSTVPFSRLTVAGITGIDIGDGTLGGNTELLRISHANKVRIGYAIAEREDTVASGQFALQLNDVDGLWVGHLGGNFNAGINIDETSDADEIITFRGPVENVFIDQFTGVVESFGSAIVINMPNETIGDIYINGIDVAGFTTNLLSFTGGDPTISGPIHFQGRVGGTVIPNFLNVPADDRIQYDVQFQFRRFVGHPNDLDIGSNAYQFAPPTGFGIGNQKATGLLIHNKGLTAGVGLFGSGWEFSRLGSGRRGAAIIPEQTGATDKEMGLAFFTGSTISATDALLKKMLLKQSGVLQLLSLPTFADDTAAGVGGLVAGDMYKTATGEVRIKL